MDNFNKALEFAFGSEGGYSNDKNDRGGPTNMGVTQDTFNSAKNRGIINTDITDVKYITKDLSTEIYKKDYWNGTKAEQLPSGVDVAVFDMAINSSNETSAKTLQKTLGVKEDGIIGENTINAAYSYEGDLVKDFNNNRREYYKDLIESNAKKRKDDIAKNGSTKIKDQSVFKNGWNNRVDNLDKFIEKEILNNNQSSNHSIPKEAILLADSGEIRTDVNYNYKEENMDKIEEKPEKISARLIFLENDIKNQTYGVIDGSYNISHIRGESGINNPYSYYVDFISDEKIVLSDILNIDAKIKLKERFI